MSMLLSMWKAFFLIMGFAIIIVSIVNMILCLTEEESIAGHIISALMLNSRNIYGDILLLIAYIITFPLAIPTIILGIIIGIIKIGFFSPSASFEVLRIAIGLEEYLDTKKYSVRVNRKEKKCRYI